MGVIKYESQLQHAGRKGMKWYQHIYGDYDSSAKYAKKGVKDTKSNKNQNESKNSNSKNKKVDSNATKTVSGMTDDELRTLINRMKLENDYRTELARYQPQKNKRAKDLLSRIGEKSIENVGTQLATYMLGTSVNSLAEKMGVKNATKTVKKPGGTEEIVKYFDGIVNPKKGQKEK